MPKPHYDVIVVGDGIAGLAAAWTARQKGHDVLLIAGLRPGKSGLIVSLHPGIEPVLNKLGLSICLENCSHFRNSGYWKTGPTPRSFHPYGAEGDHWTGYVVFENDFHQALYDTVRQSGADLKPAGPVDVIGDKNQVSGLMIDGTPIKASLTIDASGGRQILARQLRLKNLYGSPHLVARYKPCPDFAGATDPEFEFKENGWRWRGGINAGQGMECSLSLNNSGQKQSGLRCDVSWRYCAENAGAGYALIGDAALRLDPGSGSGILRAFMTAMAALHADNLSEPNQYYKNWLKNTAHSMASELYDLYRPASSEVGHSHVHQWRSEHWEQW